MDFNLIFFKSYPWMWSSHLLKGLRDALTGMYFFQQLVYSFQKILAIYSLFQLFNNLKEKTYEPLSSKPNIGYVTDLRLALHIYGFCIYGLNSLWIQTNF